MYFRKFIPDFVTGLNLVCGCLAVIFAFRNSLLYSGIAVIAAAVFDFFDGFIARLLKVKSEFGKQLDSLSDVVSFGVAPGMIVFQLLCIKDAVWDYRLPAFIPFLALLIPLCAAVRLAKFNIDERQSHSFIGLPSPAAGIFIASLAILIYRIGESPLCFFCDYILHAVLNPWFLIAVIALLSFLMVSPLPMFALKFSNASWKDNKIRYLFAGISALMIGLWFFAAVPFIIGLYVLISLVDFLINKKTQ